jgi:hypothetical protein
MLKRKIPFVVLVALSSMTLAGCKKEEVKEDAVESVEEAIEEAVTENVSNLEKVSFKTLDELKAYAKQSSSDFSAFLTANKIENVLASDGTIAINKNMTYEKYTKEYNQLAYINISPNYENGTGYLKSGVKVNFHSEETLTSENNFAKVIFNIINSLNPEYTEEMFNAELEEATNSTMISDYQFRNLGIGGNISLNVYNKPDKNERELVLSIRQELEFPELEKMSKEYKTVQEFKNDSEKIKLELESNTKNVQEVLSNSYLGKCKNVNVNLKSFNSNESSEFGQSLEISYSASEIENFPDEALNYLYESLELVLTKENLSKYVTLDDFKNYIKSLEIYAGLKTSGSVIDETGVTIEPVSLPVVGDIYGQVLEISAGITKVASANADEEDKNANEIVKYNQSINIKAKINVTAEGISKL